MANNETKLQHYVPRTYLKNFADEKKKGEFYFHALPIADSSEEKIFETNIMRACAQNYIYTLPGNTKEERLLLENFYNENYESNYTAMYNLLVDPGKTKLSSDERNLIISTMVTMLFRTTKLLNQHNEFVFRNLDYIFELCRQTKSDHFEFDGVKVSIAGKTLDQLKNEYKTDAKAAQVLLQIQVAMRLADLRCQKDGIMVLKLAEGDHEFLTSDNPVYYTIPGGGHTAPFNPDNILSLPLDKKHQLFLMPEAQDKFSIVRISSTGTMCHAKKLTANYTQSKLAERFIFGSVSGLKDYLTYKHLY